MKITLGQIFLVMGSLLVSLGFLIPSQNHQSVNPIDMLPILLMWCFSLVALKSYDDVFSKDRILYVVMPVLVFGFILLLINLNYLLSFGIREFHLYAILLGWAFFNAGLYYNTREILKGAPKKR